MKIIFSIFAVIGFLTVWALTIGAVLWATGILELNCQANCEEDEK